MSAQGVMTRSTGTSRRSAKRWQRRPRKGGKRVRHELRREEVRAAVVRAGRVSSRSVRGYTVAASSAIQSARSTATLADPTTKTSWGAIFVRDRVVTSRRERGASSRAGARAARDAGGKNGAENPERRELSHRRRLDAAQVWWHGALPGRF